DRVDQRVEHRGAAAGGGLERPRQLLAALDAGVAVQRDRRISELAWRGAGDAGGGVAGRVGDDVDLERVGHFAALYRPAPSSRCVNCGIQADCVTWWCSRERE